MSYIELKNISKSFGEKEVIKNFDLSIDKGEFISLLGPSGCGKTTLLRMVAGFIDPTEGEIIIDGKTVFSSEKNIYVKTGKRNLGMVFQSYAVWPHMTVYENVAYPLKIKKLPKEEQRERTMAILRQVGLENREKDYPWSLSGGQQQRVALARGLVMEPSVLLLDEPLSNLDVQLRQKMKEEIMDIQKRTGVTVIYVTHDQSEALQMSDRIVVLSNGNTEQIGTPEEIYHQPRTIFTANFVGRMNFIRKDGRTIGIRPEYISVIRPGDTGAKPGSHSIKGNLGRYIFEGSRNECFFDTEKGEISVETPNALPLSVGEDALLSWDRQVDFEEEMHEVDA